MSVGGSKAAAGSTMPDIKGYENKRVLVRLEGNRRVSGVLRGYDHFMNLTLADAAEELAGGQAPVPLNTAIIRGSSVLNIEGLE